jgi:hypothetical protein
VLRCVLAGTIQVFTSDSSPCKSPHCAFKFGSPTNWGRFTWSDHFLTPFDTHRTIETRCAVYI